MPAALGDYWTVVLTEDGALHACGLGADGQLGSTAVSTGSSRRGSGAPSSMAARPSSWSRPGVYHWAAVLEDGTVVTCGGGRRSRRYSRRAWL